MHKLRRIGSLRIAPLIGVAVPVLLSACSLFPQKEARIQHDKDGVIIVTYPTETRGAYIIPGNKTDTVCSEPGPDVALSTVADISGKLSANVQGKGTLDAEAAARVTSDAIQLAGRTQIVLVARELLYSLCSVSRNNKLTPEQIQHIYVEVTRVITALAEAEKTSAQARYQETLNQAHAVVQKEAEKVDSITTFLTGGSGVVIKTKLEELLSKVDKGSGPKLDDWTKNRLRRVPDAAEMRRVLLDVTPGAIDPLYSALQQ